MATGRRVTIVSSGHISTCPRMLKSADALVEAGYEVHVVATSNEPWAIEADRDLRSRRSWPATIINYRKGHSGLTYWRTGAVALASRAVVAAVGADRAPLPVVARAVGRVHADLVHAASAQPADLIYGGSTGALAAVAEAAGRLGVPYALDLEDLHAAEVEGPGSARRSAAVARVERAVLGRAAFLTTSSACIAEAYRADYGVKAAVIHNTFPLPSQAPDDRRADLDTLRVYWFSQTIGPGRGLEEAVAGLGRANMKAELTMRGRPDAAFLNELIGMAAAVAPRLTVRYEPPASPDAMIELARGYDVGLSLERTTPRNRELCMSNKAFTYLLAGVPIVFTDTLGQHVLGQELGDAAVLVPPGNIDALAAAFSIWSQHPDSLARAKRAAWQRAKDRWHWEHDAERGTLYRLVHGVLA